MNNMKAKLIASEDILDCQFAKSFLHLSKENNIIVEKINLQNLTQEDLEKLIDSKENLCIEYNPFKSVQYYHKFANVLFLQPCCLDKYNRIILDSHGFGLYSNFVGGRYAYKNYDINTYELIKKYYVKLGYEFDKPLTNNRKIVIFLDCQGDESDILNNCMKFLPSHLSVCLVAHKDKEEQLSSYFETYKNEFKNISYNVDDGKYEYLNDCEAIILRNNDIAYRAMIRGIKVVAFDFGFYTNTQTVLELWSQYNKIKHCTAFIPHVERIKNLICSIHMFGVHRSEADRLYYNTQFIDWMSRMFF